MISYFFVPVNIAKTKQIWMVEIGGWWAKSRKEEDAKIDARIAANSAKVKK